MNTSSQPRGFSLVEVMAALAILAVSALGLTAAMLVASGGTEISRRRTDMTLFARTRLERLATRTRLKVPTATTTIPVNCSAMAVAGTFNPNAAPGTGGWMLDVIDGSPPAGGGALGDDLMAGPLLSEDAGGPNTASTLSKRASFATAWSTGTDLNGCGSDTVRNDRSVFCREIHIEPLDVTQAGVTMFMLRVWVRVIQGGVPWQNSNLVVRQDIIQ
jgi:prepilin-type N-terminal cleavage/methylation domain-containing protein